MHAEALVGIDDIKHIAEKKNLVGDDLEKISEEWEAQKKAFYLLTGEKPPTEGGTDEFDRELEHLNPLKKPGAAYKLGSWDTFLFDLYYALLKSSCSNLKSGDMDLATSALTAFLAGCKGDQ
ncbi:hypothetical protein ACLOJK_037066 [Asimina triloba]